MAGEITNSSSFSISKDLISDSITNSASVTLTGSDYVKETQLVTTGGAAINLGNLATCGEFLIANNDATNYVSILSSVGGTTFLEIKPLNTARGYFAATVTAPAAKANTGSVRIAYMIAPI
jgi:hypothetical protein